MTTISLISTILVLIGTIFISASIFISTSVNKSVPKALTFKWMTLTALMVFFLVGYVCFLILQLTKVSFPLELLVGVIFMGGAIFVFQIMNLAKFTITRLRDTNENLEKIVEKRTADLYQVNKELHAEIIEKETVEIDLKAAKEEAESMNKAKSEFLANMSHEIRTPMNGIIGFTEVLLGSNLPDEQKKQLDLIQKSSVRLLDLINDILDYSKIEAQKLTLECIPFDLQKLMHECMKMLAVKAHEKGLEIIYSIHHDVPTALAGDPGRLRQILINLVGNAIKFTDEGEIVVTVACGSTGPSRKSSGEDDVQLLFSVQDTGIGIPANKLHLIFNSFTQADGATTRKYGGTGLGLTISAQLAKLMGGDIHVESKEGTGTTFSFSILLQQREEVALPYNNDITIEMHKLKTLIVDDNDTNRKMLAAMLEKFVGEIHLADSGINALDILREQHFDLFLIDVQMPGIDGFTLATEIKKLPAHQETPIIILTSSGQRGEAFISKQIGIAGYLMKPISTPELIDAIRAVLTINKTSEHDQPLVTRHMLKETPKGIHILVAEDDPINQVLARTVLEKNNYWVTLANDGRQALKALETTDFDAILMDVQMPVMDGIQTTAAIRKQEKSTGNHIPIIAMTAHAMVGDQQKCLDAGMDSYVSKPIDVPTLMKKLASIGL